MTTFQYLVDFTETYRRHKDAPIAIREAHLLDVMARYQFLPPRGRGEIPAHRSAADSGSDPAEDRGDLLAGRLRLAEIGFSPEPLLGRSVGFFYDPQRLDALLADDAYTAEQKSILRGIREFWEGEETRRRIRDRFPVYMQQAMPENIYWEHAEIAFPLFRVVGMHLDYEKLLRIGLDGLRAEAENRRCIRSSPAGARCRPDALYEGMLMALDTLSGVCKRYAAALRETRPALAAALEHIAHKPPRTFIEAMQLSWLYSLISGALNYGRMDVYLGDFLARDLDSGTLREEDALAYVCNLWELIAERDTVFHSRVIIGGRGRRSEKNADRFARLAIEASRRVLEAEPQLSLRFYEGQDPALMELALDCLGEGRTYPILYNDDVNIPAVADAFEVTEEQAEDYMMFGCGEYVLNHRSYGSPNGIINLVKALEAVLGGGRDLLDGKAMGMRLEGGLERYDTFDALLDAYKRQLRYYIEILAEQERLEYDVVAEEGSFLFMSMLFDDCMERGRGIFDGGIRYLGGTLETYGNINAANSLYALKSVVYEQGAIDRSALTDALRADFEGYERERRLLLEAEKYGNDLDGVDALACELHDFVCNAVREQKDRVGLHSYLVVIINNEANTILGRFTAASPDGRKAREPLANGNNPAGGSDISGVTAMLNSLVKLDTHIHAGAVQNMKFNASLFNEKRPLLRSLLCGYFESGGAQAMITVLNKDDLEQSILHPEEYRHLMVRVGGFSARFVTLAPDVQREIASRTMY